MVVVSSGAFNSPLILERSGIGGKSILKKNGVPLIVDLPGVGENWQGEDRLRITLTTELMMFQTILLLHSRKSRTKMLTRWIPFCA